jgi:hypothetical protein
MREEDAQFKILYCAQRNQEELGLRAGSTILELVVLKVILGSMNLDSAVAGLRISK